MDVSLDVSTLLDNFSQEVAAATKRAVIAETKAQAWQARTAEAEARLHEFQQAAIERDLADVDAPEPPQG